MRVSGPLEAPERVLLVQLRRLGDVLLTTPLLDDLHRAYPRARLDFLVGHAAAPLLDGHPLIHERLTYARDHPMRMIARVRSRRYDWVVDAQSSPRTAQLTLLSGARASAGFRIPGWGWVYTHAVSRALPRPTWVVRDRQRLLEALGTEVGAPTLPRIWLSDTERAAGRATLAALGGPEGAPRVGLLLSAGVPAREWRPEGYAELASALAAEGVMPVLFRTPDDATHAARFHAHTRAALEMPPLPPRPLAAAIAACAAFVSGDTGPAHIATAVDVPRVTIYGPSPPETWNPGLPTTLTVHDERVPCLGCARPRCPIGHDCMTGVSAEAVLAHVHTLLGRFAWTTPSGR